MMQTKVDKFVRSAGFVDTHGVTHTFTDKVTRVTYVDSLLGMEFDGPESHSVFLDGEAVTDVIEGDGCVTYVAGKKKVTRTTTPPTLKIKI